MADNPQNRLEAHGQQPVPPVDPGFADRLESKLRVEHAELAPTAPQRVRVLLPRLAAAVVIVVAGVFGLVALGSDDAGVPIAVVDEDPAAPLVAADGGDDGDDADDGDVGDEDGTEPADPSDGGSAIVDPTVVPSPTVQDLEPTPTPTESTTQPTAVIEPTVSPLPTLPPATTTPTTATPATAVPLPPSTSVQSTATPTVTSQQAATPVPLATPIPVPSPTATSTPTPEPTPTVEREPAPIELACTARVVGDAVGIICSWAAPDIDRAIASYELIRSRNDSAAVVVSRQRGNAPRSYSDREVAFGDHIIYLVQGLDADDTVVAASIREVVMVPAQG